VRDDEAALEELEERMASLRRALRAALVQRDSARARRLRAELRRTEREWEELAAPAERKAPRRLPAREQAHRVLTLLGVAAAPRLISAVHGAFFPGDLPASRLWNLRRDEERSYRSAPGARPYYLCPALTADLLAPARGLLTVSTWPLERRIIGPHSPRVDFLTAAVRISTEVLARRRAGRPWPPQARARAERLLQELAAGIPDALPPPARGAARADPEQVARAAETELAIHAETDRRERAAAAERARRLGDTERLFGIRLAPVPGRATMGR